MKKLSAVLLLVLFVITFSLCGTVFAEQEHWRVLHADTAFCSDETMQNVTLRLPRYASVEVLSSQDGVAKVIYMGATGYVYERNLYLSAESVYTDEYSAKITSSELGKEVFLYKYPYIDAPIVANLSDGQKVTVKQSQIQYNDFTEVVCDGVSGFVLNANVTEGLTLNEIVAITVGVVTFVLVALVLALLLYSKRLKTVKLRRQEQLVKEERENVE